MFEFYHVTAKKNLAKIAQQGLLSGSFWASGDLAHDITAYYQETVEDEGDTPVILRVFVDDLDKSFLKPDMPGLEEPITTVIGKSEEAVWNDWQNSAKTWEACVELIGSCKYTQVIPASFVYVEVDNDNLIKLTELYQVAKPKLKK